MQQIEITENSFKFDHEEIIDVLVSNHWGERDQYSKEDIYKLFCGSSYFAIASIDGKSIGYIRAISDNTLVTFIAELIVHKEFQRQGVGSELMKHFNEKYAHTTIWSCVFEDNVEFMEKCGIRNKKQLFSCTRKALA